MLFGGCLIKSASANDRGNIQDADLEGWPVSLRKLVGKFPAIKTIIPGHEEKRGK